MSHDAINERILREIRETSGGDEKLSAFLIELLYEEAEHAGQWRWKETYKKKIELYSQEWGYENEN